MEGPCMQLFVKCMDIVQTWGTLQQCRCTTGQPYTTFVGSNVVYPTLPPYYSRVVVCRVHYSCGSNCCLPYIHTLLQFTSCLQGTLLQGCVAQEPTFETTFTKNNRLENSRCSASSVFDTRQKRLRQNSFFFHP